MPLERGAVSHICSATATNRVQYNKQERPLFHNIHSLVLSFSRIISIFQIMTRGVKRKLQNAHDTSCELSYTTGRLPKAPAPIFMDESDGLCENCTKIDLDDLLRRNDVDHHLGTFVCHLPEISKLESSPCRLCRYFATMRWQIQDPAKVVLGQGNPLPSAHSEKRIGILASQSHLRAFSAFRRFGLNKHQRNLKKVSDTVFLAVVPGKDWGNGMIKNIMYDCRNTAAYFTRTHGTSTLPNETFFGRKISPKSLDYSLISSWISFCDMSHKKICGRRERGSIPDFRVVDCNWRKIVPAPPDCQYIALSYLWGTITTEQSSENEISSAESIPLSCPEVIEDAMEVVKRLGHQYLWIDRFCIDQKNKDQKHIQIANMDSIYSNATLTIIAAAGADPSFGLPGARLQRRIQQPCVQYRSKYSGINTSKPEN